MGLERVYLDLESVQRILLAVNLPLVPDSDPDKLLADLEGCRSIYRTGVALRERHADRDELARRILAAFEKGNALLDKYIRTYGALYLRPYRMRLDGLRKDLADSPGLSKLTGFEQLSAFENLVGLLHDIFTRHFGIDRRYTVRRDDPEVNVKIGGPFIRFAEAAMNEMGLTYSPRSIADALAKSVGKTGQISPISPG